MDNDDSHPLDPLEPPAPELDIKEGDSESTRKQKQFLKTLTWEQKISLSAFLLLLLVVPITLAAVYTQTDQSSQASQPTKPPLNLETTPTPTPEPVETVVPAP